MVTGVPSGPLTQWLPGLGEEVELPPRDPRRNLRSGLDGIPRGALEPHRRDVGADDLPALPSQPDRVAPLAASHVDRSPRGQLRRLADQVGIGASAPHMGAARIAVGNV
jgi:hypothetical protein